MFTSTPQKYFGLVFGSTNSITTTSPVHYRTAKPHNILMIIGRVTVRWRSGRFYVKKIVINLFFFILLFQNSSSVQVESAASDDGVLKKGLLWQQKDKLFSRWKERYFILTKDYFHCFKKATSRITEMGGFIFKVMKILYV